jgi:hypothetical protein
LLGGYCGRESGGTYVPGGPVAAAHYHPDFEDITARQLVELGFDPVYRGHREGIRYRQQRGEEWGEFDVKPEELFDLGDNRMLLIGRGEGRSLTSSVPLAIDWCFLLTVSAGRVRREELFFDRGEAFRAQASKAEAKLGGAALATTPRHASPPQTAAMVPLSAAAR